MIVTRLSSRCWFVASCVYSDSSVSDELSIQLARTLGFRWVAKLHEGCSLELSILVLEHPNPRWVYPLLLEQLSYLLLLSVERQSTNENCSVISLASSAASSSALRPAFAPVTASV